MSEEQTSKAVPNSTIVSSTDSETAMDELTNSMEVASLTEPEQKTPSITLEDLFAIPEIGEAIMLQMDPRTLYTSMHVNKHWKAIYDSSPALKGRMFLNQEPGKHNLTILKKFFRTSNKAWTPNTVIAPLNDRPPDPNDPWLWRNYPDDLDYRRPRVHPWWKLHRYFTHPLFPRWVVTLEWTPRPVPFQSSRKHKRINYVRYFNVHFIPDYQWRDRKYPTPGRLPAMLETMFLTGEPTFLYLQITDWQGMHEQEVIWPGMRLIDVLHLVQWVRTGRWSCIPTLDRVEMAPIIRHMWNLSQQVHYWKYFAKSIGIKLMPVTIENRAVALDVALDTAAADGALPPRTVDARPRLHSGLEASRQADGVSGDGDSAGNTSMTRGRSTLSAIFCTALRVTRHCESKINGIQRHSSHKHMSFDQHAIAYWATKPGCHAISSLAFLFTTFVIFSPHSCHSYTLDSRLEVSAVAGHHNDS
ncbi:hypothetical protein AC578_6506 [Pseudocercospora eumusae]|uniref:F-box domain-containing protein n=1 Tax=Pseudocercospora eumusae TaxID=321146 RepID=A0A139HI07_9PEZI|nr:hypothetical protein AC578_6506 [Pseudocercospora eumusae]